MPTANGLQPVSLFGGARAADVLVEGPVNAAPSPTRHHLYRAVAEERNVEEPSEKRIFHAEERSKPEAVWHARCVSNRASLTRVYTSAAVSTRADVSSWLALERIDASGVHQPAIWTYSLGITTLYYVHCVAWLTYS